MIKNNTKLVSSTFIFVLIIYIFDFYIFDTSNQHFSCVVVENFKILNFENIRLPIHCDEGPYRFASENIHNFFTEINPYQGRPLFVGALAIFRKFFELFSFLDLSEYQNFKISMLCVQLLVLFGIVKIFISITELNLDSKLDFLIIFSLLCIPSLRWNLFLSSVGNITFLLFLLSLNYFKKENYDNNKKNRLYILFGILSLAHLSSIVYALIIELIDIIRTKKIHYKGIFIRFFNLSIFQLLYRLAIQVSEYTYFDWHKEIHNQFYWIISALRNEENLENCQTFDTFWRCNFDVTISYLGYFLIIIFYFLSLFIFNKFMNKKNPDLIFSAMCINIFIFIFWSIQGIYEAFRFINYSIGYFLFFSVIIYNISFKKNIFLSSSIITYFFSISYLEPYNTAIYLPQFNLLTILSITSFLYFIYIERKKKYQQIK
tara:strand:- start:786 stop:2078 length:1293 start_codon:yes stop_codon:yes gene_type:complete